MNLNRSAPAPWTPAQASGAFPQHWEIIENLYTECSASRSERRCKASASGMGLSETLTSSSVQVAEGNHRISSDQSHRFATIVSENTVTFQQYVGKKLQPKARTQFYEAWSCNRKDWIGFYHVIATEQHFARRLHRNLQKICDGYDAPEPL